VPDTSRLAALRLLAPGLALALAVAVAAFALERLTGWPAMVLALALGVAAHPLSLRPGMSPGLVFAVKKVLRWGVALLGLRIALGDIVALGPWIVVIVVASMALTIAAGVALARALGRDGAFGALAGGATAVCGASAALAISTVLPQGDKRAADTVFVVLAVNALSTVAMLLYPWLGTALGFDERTIGVFLGATIHDVAQVVGAGYSVSETAGDSAVIVKLFRVFLLLPVVLIIGAAFAGKEAGSRAKVPVPVFALVFLALVAVNSLGLVPGIAKTIGGEASRWFLLLAIAALGLDTSLKRMVALGWRPVAVVTGATLALLLIVGAGLAV
jgi:uncharacterized integral membrane protein (TIGR00698 family)